ncbi:MAG: hypothetical protein OXN17_03090 [Candidatus Poribacteria bacterium]|nr:hypothetical protein [Candidatus Poribacteria bacterium]MDE0504200.1 hypothetical protein [Candidatus Poribacteria bacterium]
MKDRITIDDLYSDAGSYDEEAVLLTLRDKIIFSQEHEILFVIDPTNLKARKAILLYALAKKMLKANQKIDDEIITNAEITDKVKLKDNTVRGTIKRLRDQKFLVRSGSGYEIPVFKVEDVLDSLRVNGD